MRSASMLPHRIAPSLVRGLEQALVVARRMEIAAALHIHAAVVIVGRHHLAHALARDHLGADIGVLVEHLDLARLVVVVRGVQAPVKRPLVIRPQSIFSRAMISIRVCSESAPLPRNSALLALELRLDLRVLAAQSLGDVGAARDHAAVARRGADAEHAALQHDGVDAIAAQFERRRQPAIARTHDHHVGLGRRVLRQGVVGCPGLPPPRLRLEAGSEDVVAH